MHLKRPTGTMHPASEFNAAGVHPATLMRWIDQTTQVERVPGIVAAYDAEITEKKIDAWFLSYDFLSFVQDHTVGMFKALGHRHRMAGPRISPIDAQLIFELGQTLLDEFHGDSLVNLLQLLHGASPSTGANFWQVKDILFNSHKTNFYYYGLMVIPNYFNDNDNDGLWDIYGGSETIHF